MLLKTRFCALTSLTVLLLFLSSFASSEVFVFSPPSVSYLGDEVMTVTSPDVDMYEVDHVLVDGVDVLFMPDSRSELRFVTPCGEIGTSPDVVFLVDGIPLEAEDAFLYQQSAQILTVQGWYPKLLPTNFWDPGLYLYISGGVFDSDFQAWIGTEKANVVRQGMLGALIEVYTITSPGKYNLTISSQGRTLTIENAVQFEYGVPNKLYGAFPNSFDGYNPEDIESILLIGSDIDMKDPPMQYQEKACKTGNTGSKYSVFDSVFTPKLGTILNPVEGRSTEHAFPIDPLHGVLVDPSWRCGDDGGPGTPNGTLIIEVGLVPYQQSGGVLTLVATPEEQNLVLTAGMLRVFIGPNEVPPGGFYTEWYPWGGLLDSYKSVFVPVPDSACTGCLVRVFYYSFADGLVRLIRIDSGTYNPCTNQCRSDHDCDCSPPCP